MIGCSERNLALPLELATELAVEGLLVGLDGQEHVGPLGEAPSKYAWVGVERFRLDQHAIEIQAAQKFLKRGPLGGCAGVVGLLSQGHTKCSV